MLIRARPVYTLGVLKSDPLPNRKFSAVDAGRVAIWLAVLIPAFAMFFFLLSSVQKITLPAAPGGATGPWIVRPAVALHFCATAIVVAVLVPIVVQPLRQRWVQDDQRRLSKWDPLHERPIARARYYIKAVFLLVVYAAALPFYLWAWTAIDPTGITEHKPWGSTKYSYAQVVSLQTIPAGQRSESLREDGPWYEIGFKDGRTISLSERNEACSESELIAIAGFVAEHSKRSWTVRPDAHYP